MRMLLAVALALPLLAVAQRRGTQTQTPPDAMRAVVLHTADVYVAPDMQSQRVSEITPGHEVLITSRNGPWVKVFANIDVQDEKPDDEPEFATEEAVLPRAGWIRDKGIVSSGTANGDKLIYGEAATLEATAAEPHAPKAAGPQAALLYRRLYEYFPQSPLADESEWRSADVLWQEEKYDKSSLPSMKDPNPDMRPQMYTKALQNIVKRGSGKYPALAAWDLLDTKVCGDWQGLPKCPESELTLYAKYADQFPDSPRTPEALWNAAYRAGVLWSMYSAEENKKRADANVQRAREFRDHLAAKFPNSDYTARAVSLVYRVEQGIAIYGNDRD